MNVSLDHGEGIAVEANDYVIHILDDADGEFSVVVHLKSKEGYLKRVNEFIVDKDCEFQESELIRDNNDSPF